jgi:hypothetical protein
VPRLKHGSTTFGKPVDAAWSRDGVADGASEQREAMRQCAWRGTRTGDSLIVGLGGLRAEKLAGLCTG